MSQTALAIMLLTMAGVWYTARRLQGVRLGQKQQKDKPLLPVSVYAALFIVGLVIVFLFN